MNIAVSFAFACGVHNYKLSLCTQRAVYTSTYRHIYIYIQTDMYKSVYIYIYIYLHIYIYICTYTHTPIYTHA